MQYTACLAITVAIQSSSREKLYQEPSVIGVGIENLLFYKIVNILSWVYLTFYLNNNIHPSS